MVLNKSNFVISFFLFETSLCEKKFVNKTFLWKKNKLVNKVELFLEK